MQFWKLILTLVAHAQGVEGVSDTDLTKLASVFRPHVYALTKPIVVYNWHAAASASELHPTSRDPADFAALQKMANRYWDKQGELTDTKDLFGTGFYVAVDPIVSRSYGGNDDRLWVLTQIQLHEGLRILDLARDGGLVLPMGQEGLITRLGCPAWWKDQPLLKALLNPNASHDFPKCQAAVRKVVRDVLQVDAFAYSFGGMAFRECDAAPVHAGFDDVKKYAFVITNGARISPDDVRFYNRTTTDDEGGRLRIQSMFAVAKNLPSVDGHAYMPANMELIRAALLAKGYKDPDTWLSHTILNSSASYKGVETSYAVLCSKYIMPTEEAPATVLPLDCISVVTNTGADAVRAAYVAPTSIHFSDLKWDSQLWSAFDGRAITPGLRDWMRANLYSCTDSGLGYKRVFP